MADVGGMAVTEGVAVILELLAGPRGALVSAGLDVSAGDDAGETALAAGELRWLFWSSCWFSTECDDELT